MFLGVDVAFALDDSDALGEIEEWDCGVLATVLIVVFLVGHPQLFIYDSFTITELAREVAFLPANDTSNIFDIPLNTAKVNRVMLQPHNLIFLPQKPLILLLNIFKLLFIRRMDISLIIIHIRDAQDLQLFHFLLQFPFLIQFLNKISSTSCYLLY